MSELTLRSTKGSPLTNSEIDGNVVALNNDKQEAGDITYEALDANDDVGSSSDQVARGNHAHGGVYLPLAGGQLTGLLKFSKGADIASAAALTLGSDGNYFDVTGVIAITSINMVGVGTVIKLHFDDALTLTHHATNLILPGGADITTVAGDEAEFIEYATGDWRLTNYQVNTPQIEGTWNPSVLGNATYLTQRGVYKIVDGMCHFWGHLTINVLGTGSTTLISLLPIANAGIEGSPALVNVSVFGQSATNIVSSFGLVVNGDTTIDILSRTAASSSPSSNAIFQNITSVHVSGSYPV